ncbi:MAG: Glu-tRNA(Gln) amidotransferase subunit GatE [Candidatus Heimdallarchaeaceae archaeon]
MNYKNLGLKVGLEIHFQLDTKHKLFCDCSTEMKEKKPIMTIKRRLHPVASELGKVDVAAQYEYLRDRVFYYQVFKNETCLVELDEEPPHPLNPEALKTALQISLLLKCKIPDEIHIMRKTVIDGSNTSGFQRTAIVGFDGYLKFKEKKIPISQVTLEEDAAAKVKEEGKNVIYKLNRLGIPLVEIDTGILENFTPKEIQEIAYTIGLIAKSSGKIKRGIGTIRQDVNVSIRRGARVEIKGVQELGLISKVIEDEIERQINLIRRGEKVKEETRAAKQDGTTEFIRPLPGANRMYPETDVPPIIVSEKLLREIKRRLPELLTEKIERFKKNYKLSDLLANEIVKSELLETFERIVKEIKVQPSLIASVFTSQLKDLKRRENLDVKKLKEEHFYQIFSYLKEGKIQKEAIPEILKYFIKNPEAKLDEIIIKLDLRPLSVEELKKIVKEIKEKNPDLSKEKIFGIVMSKVRGRANIEDVKRIFRKYLK